MLETLIGYILVSGLIYSVSCIDLHEGIGYNAIAILFGMLYGWIALPYLLLYGRKKR